MSDSSNLDLVRRLRDWPPKIEMTADGWNALIDTATALFAEAAASIEQAGKQGEVTDEMVKRGQDAALREGSYLGNDTVGAIIEAALEAARPVGPVEPAVVALECIAKAIQAGFTFNANEPRHRIKLKVGTTIEDGWLVGPTADDIRNTFKAIENIALSALHPDTGTDGGCGGDARGRTADHAVSAVDHRRRKPRPSSDHAERSQGVRRGLWLEH